MAEAPKPARSKPGIADSVPPATSKPDDYDLAVDSQVEKFIETKQKLTYFLITASVAVIAFTVNFFVTRASKGGRVGEVTPESALVVGSALAGLATSGLALLVLRFEHRSFRLHLQYRYQRKTWEDLTPTQQRRWDAVNAWAARLLHAALACLFAEIALAVAFFVVFLW